MAAAAATAGDRGKSHNRWTVEGATGRLQWHHQQKSLSTIGYRELVSCKPTCQEWLEVTAPIKRRRHHSSCLSFNPNEELVAIKTTAITEKPNRKERLNDEGRTTKPWLTDWIGIFPNDDADCGFKIYSQQLLSHSTFVNYINDGRQGFISIMIVMKHKRGQMH